MILRLYTTRSVSGRCVILAQKLARVTASAEAVNVAERLFAGQYSLGNAAEVKVRFPAALAELQKVCAEYGIELEASDGTLRTE